MCTSSREQLWMRRGWRGAAWQRGTLGVRKPVEIAGCVIYVDVETSRLMARIGRGAGPCSNGSGNEGSASGNEAL